MTDILVTFVAVISQSLILIVSLIGVYFCKTKLDLEYTLQRCLFWFFVFIAASEAYSIVSSFLLSPLSYYLVSERGYTAQQTGLVLAGISFIELVIKVVGFIVLLVGVYKANRQ